MSLNKNKKIVISVVAVAIIIAIVCGIIFGIVPYLKTGKPYDAHDYTNLLPKTDKVILMIGDGMGENHIKIGETYLGRDMVFESFSNIGYVSTNSLSKTSPTDSAAGATAMSCGVKVQNSFVAMNKGKNLKSISEYAKEKGKGVGIVTTDSLTGATPSGFSSHAKTRDDREDIIIGQINSDIDLFLGTGDTIYNAYKSQFEAKGYTYTNKFDELNLNLNKIIGVFETISNDEHTNLKPTLIKMVEFAIDYLEEKYPNGYFLMIEGAHIDKMSHNNEIFKMIEYLNEFDKAISYVNSFFNNTNNVALLVTADHETGNLAKFKGTKEDINNSLYRSKAHSSQNVKYFFKLTSNSNQIDLPEKIDNVDIFNICYRCLIQEN